ncbi:MAG: ATP-binding protein [Woeseia sp.]
MSATDAVSTVQVQLQRPTVLFIAVALLLQAIFWFGINPLFGGASVPADAYYRDAEVASLDAATPEALDRAQFTPETLPWSSCCEPGAYALRLNFDWPASDQALGLIPVIDIDNFFAYVNGHEVYARGRLAPQATYHGTRRELLRVPADVLQPADNVLEIIAVRNFLPYTDFNLVIMAPYEELYRQTLRRFIVLNDFREISALLISFIAVLTLVLLPRVQNKAFGFWLAALAGSWALRSLHYSWLNPPYDPQTRVILYFVATNGIALAWFCFTDAWTGVAGRRLRTAAVVIYIAVVATIAALISSQHGLGFEPASTITNGFMLLIIVSASIRLLVHVFSVREQRVWELAAFALCFTCLYVDIFNELLWQRNAGYTDRAAPFLALAMVAMLASRNLRLYHSLGQFNASLKDTLRLREAEIRENVIELQAVERARDLAEQRTDIMRDMHDGVGGQLVSLLSAIQARRMQPADVEREIQKALSELRLLVDSLFDLGDDLSVALGNFRQRMQPLVESAGFTLGWNVAALPDELRLPSKSVIAVCRILQEAVSNALQHSGGSHIQIVAAGSQSAINLTVSDDGRKRTQSDRQGHGLDNMRRRARGLGGACAIDIGANGTTVRLTMPLAATDSMDSDYSGSTST